MRIISNFKDYYDCMQGHGYDPMIVYMRTPRPVYTEDSSYDYLSRYPYRHCRSDDNDFEYSHNSIGFCGKWYQYFEIFKGCGAADPVLQTYSILDFDKFVENNFSKKQKEFYYADRDEFRWNKPRPRVFSRYQIETQIYKFNNPEFPDTKPDALFIANNTPIIINHRRETWKAPQGKCYTRTYDGCLKDYSFFKVMEPWEAYQELSMYVAGPLVNSRKTIPEMDNKTKVYSHGFDKYSFRKDKQK